LARPLPEIRLGIATALPFATPDVMPPISACAMLVPAQSIVGNLLRACGATISQSP
jgi:hypothetical protein